MIIKNDVLEILYKVKRPGWENLLKYLDTTDYYTTASSTKWHGAKKYGLMHHCYSLYYLLLKLNYEFKLNIDKETMIITSFLHDLCKIDMYILTSSGYIYNQTHPKGHAKLSLSIIKKYIELTKEEEEIITYHMGMYGTKEFNSMNGEYTLSELVNVYNRNKICKLFYFCDDMSSQFLEE